MEALGVPPKSLEWVNRLAGESEAWSQQLPALCDAYLAYCSGSEASMADSGDQSFSLICIDINADNTKIFHHPATELWTNVTLLRHGYLTPSPSKPSVAMSLQVLELFANVQRRGPSVSVQILAKAWCDSRNVPYVKYFRTQLAKALDVYLQIQREVQRRLDVALGRDTPDWRMLNTCKACTYKLEDEPPLEFSMLVTCDGGDSLKRCADAGSADHRQYPSSYYIAPAQVDKFQHEVPNRRIGKRTQKGEGEEEESVCEKRWKNAKINNRADGDKPRTIFHETGVFIATCRHSFVLTVCDMIKSGEQAKYGLATIDKLISTFGSNILMGYDIGCTFKGTATRSALVGPRVQQSGFDMCVGSFHGPAHNRTCQLDNHPHNRAGTGLSDLENCETVFSSSNRVASTTRLASTYHRHQKIDIHYTAWDDDQYSILGYLLRTKYMHALKTIELAETTIARLNPAASANDLDRYHNEERAYLESLKTELPEDAFSIEYITLLERMDAKQAEYESSKGEYLMTDGPSTSDLRRTTLLTSRLEARRRITLEQLLALQEAVAKLEDDHDVSQRWTRENPQWIEAEHRRRHREFQKCLDELERLVVQRLLELSKAGLANTGYKLRMHIMKALTARSQSIKTALSRYNQAAAVLHGADVPKLTWEEVADVSVLADFDLLRGSRRLILEKAWAKPENRRCVESWHRLNRAEEELARLNIEVRRVRTSIIDEQNTLLVEANRIQLDDPLLGWAAHRYVSRRLKVNELVMHQLRLIEKIPGYTGTRDIGVRLGSRLEQRASTPTVPVPSADDTTVVEPSHGINQPSGEGVDGNIAIGANDPIGLDPDHDDETSDEFARWQTILDSAT